MGLADKVKSGWEKTKQWRTQQNAIAKIYSHRDYGEWPEVPGEDTVIRAIEPISLEDRIKICKTTISVKTNSPFKIFYVGGHTALTLAIHKKQYGVAAALIKDIPKNELIDILKNSQEYDDKRSKLQFKKVVKDSLKAVATFLIMPAIVIFPGYREVFVRLFKNNFTPGTIVSNNPLNLLLMAQKVEQVRTLLKDLNFTQLEQLLGSDPKSIALLTVNNIFNENPLKDYANQKELDLSKICLEAFDQSVGTNKTVLSIALTQRFNPQNHFTLQQRKDFLLNAQNKPLAREILACVRAGILLETFEQWLQGFTAEEKIAALTPSSDAAGAENSLIIAVFEAGDPDLTQWLVNQGIELPERFRARGHGPGIQYGQSIHNAAVHHTVGESLTELKKAFPLEEDEIAAAITRLQAHAARLPRTNDNSDLRAVSRRALLRITTPAFLSHRERISGVSVREMLAYFYIGIQKIKNKDEREAAWTVFYNQLFTIQRDYNTDAGGADGTICVGGTLNQLSIGLQAVYPEHVWVKFVTRQTNAIEGFLALPELLQKAFERSEDKDNFAKLCAEKLTNKIISDELWPLVEADLRRAMKEALFNRTLKPTERKILPTEIEVDNIVTRALEIIKTGKLHGSFEPHDMTGPAKLVQDALDRITRSNINSKNNAGGSAVLHTLLNLPRSSDETKMVSDNLGLLPSQRYLDEKAKNIAPSSRVAVSELYQRSLNSTLSGYNMENEYRFLQQCKLYACEKLPDAQLPESFKNIACDRTVLDHLIKEFKDKQRRNASASSSSSSSTSHQKVYMLDIFEASEMARAWLASADFDRTMEILEIHPFDEERPDENDIKGLEKYRSSLDDYLFSNSVKINQALFKLAPEMIKKELKEQVAETVIHISPPSRRT